MVNPPSGGCFYLELVSGSGFSLYYNELRLLPIELQTECGEQDLCLLEIHLAVGGYETLTMRTIILMDE